MAVGAEGESDLGVAEDLHDDAGGYTHDQQGGRGGVAGIVQPSWADVGVFEKLVPVAAVGA